MDKNCQKKLENICDQLGDELNSERCQNLKEQLKQCPGCCAYIDTIKKTIEIYRYLPEEKISDELHHSLWKRLQL